MYHARTYEVGARTSEVGAVSFSDDDVVLRRSSKSDEATALPLVCGLSGSLLANAESTTICERREHESCLTLTLYRLVNRFHISIAFRGETTQNKG